MENSKKKKLFKTQQNYSKFLEQYLGAILMDIFSSLYCAFL